MKYCVACKRNVTPVKDFNWLVFIFLCGCFYIPFYMMQKPHCPICRGSMFEEPKPV
ncbi:MAG: hypothetical protein M5U21_08635 [Fimbriimonadaceae bacterium]|nr:hypothetical protein [Fimbriimonadaceae bacterium]